LLCLTMNLNTRTDTMKSFIATVEMDYDTFYIDYRPKMQYNNRFAVFSIRRNAVYVETLQDAMNQIDFYNDQDIEQACLQSELDHNQ
jgi:hypothetical protein